MTPEKFLQELLASQNLSDTQEQALQANKKEVTDFLRAEFGDAPKIKYAGSREKGTMIAEQYDLDIVCYFPSDDARSLKEIREDVSTHLKKKYLIEPKSSAERITNLRGTTAPDDYHIDVVPGRFIENSNDVFLHVAYGDKERMQTNLKVHIEHVVNSGCVPIIRLTKLWARRNNVAIKTFILELFVIRALSGSREKAQLAKSFRQVLQALKDDIGTLQLVDPANLNNVVSRLVNTSEKEMIANAADIALKRIIESDDITDWEGVFGTNGTAKHHISPQIPTSHRNPSQGFTPRSPWSANY